MSDKPILFSAPMVRAILAGSKTQTRRILKPQPDFRGGVGTEHDPEAWGWEDDMGDHVPVPQARLRWSVGDRLWVKEAIIARPMANFLTGEPTNAIVAAYAADDGDVVEEAGFNLCPWWNGGEDRRRRLASIHMPRRVSRITLEVMGVRVERLNQISEEDARAEGVETDVWDQALAVRNYAKKDGWFCMWGGPDCYTDPDTYVDADQICRASYRTLWNHINGTQAWDLNPWVVAVEFRRVTP